MKRNFNQVYQFKIALEGIKPPIWRRIQVPENYTFWELHVAIQDAMGWADYHLHEFEVYSPEKREKVKIGIPQEGDEDDFLPEKETEDEPKVLAGWEHKIADYFTQENKTAAYLYDFGANWQHAVELEKVLPRDKGVKYPVCVGGERACPPEDCGGPYSYEELLEIVKDPTHEEYEEKRDWLGGDFDPDHFDPKEVKFDNPAKRLKMAMGE